VRSNGGSVRAYKFRAYPTKAQAVALDLHLSEACRLYNAALQERRDAWKMRRQRITFASQSRQIKEIRAAGDIGIASAKAATLVLRRVELAFAAFFRRVKAGEKPGYPRFQPARRYDSFTYQADDGIKIRPRTIYAYGIGEIAYRRHRAVEGTPKQVTFKREAGRWHVIVAADVLPNPLQPSSAAVGVDVGLVSFATLSDGAEIENPRHERVAARGLRRAQRSLSRKRRGSNRLQKAVRRLQRALGTVRRQRADFHHKVSRSLVNSYGLIAVEDLNFKGMARTMLARSIHDAGWAAFINKLTYKAESAGRQFVMVDPRGTSQTCPCGQVVRKHLSERRHDCPACGLLTSRDHAAAMNILRLGLSRQAPTAASAAVA
jgi:putative transposase